MFDEQIEELASILKNKDWQEYAGEEFLKLIQAVICKDPMGGMIAVKDIKHIIFHMPTVIFWNKMRRFYDGTFKNYDDQVKMASRFNGDNKKYVEFVKRQIYFIDAIEEESKIDWYAMLTRCWILQEMENSLYFKLAQFLKQCTHYELEYIREMDFDDKKVNNTMVSSLYQYGLVEQKSSETEVYYVLSGFGKALKGNCLNYSDDINCEVYRLYNEVDPIPISEPLLPREVDQILGMYDTEK